MSRQLVGDGDIEITKAQNRNYALAEGFHRMTSNKSSNTWTLFLRYKVQTEREYRRAIEDFERLKALRNELPNEPILELNPNQTIPLATLHQQTQFRPGNRSSRLHQNRPARRRKNLGRPPTF